MKENSSQFESKVLDALGQLNDNMQLLKNDLDEFKMERQKLKARLDKFEIKINIMFDIIKSNRNCFSNLSTYFDKIYK